MQRSCDEMKLIKKNWLSFFIHLFLFSDYFLSLEGTDIKTVDQHLFTMHIFADQKTSYVNMAPRCKPPGTTHARSLSPSLSHTHRHTQTQSLCTYTHVEKASVGGRKREEKCLESPNKIYATNLLSSIIIPVKKTTKK